MTEAEQIMKRCQVGTRNYDEANNLHAACYGLIGKLSAQRQWVGLTDEEIAQGCKESWVTEQAWQSAVWWAEAKLKDKNDVAQETNS